MTQQNTFHANSTQKTWGNSSNRPSNLKTKSVIRDKRGDYTTTDPIHHKGGTIINIYAPNNTAPKYLRQKWTELSVERSTSVTVGDFNIREDN